MTAFSSSGIALKNRHSTRYEDKIQKMHTVKPLWTPTYMDIPLQARSMDFGQGLGALTLKIANQIYG